MKTLHLIKKLKEINMFKYFIILTILLAALRCSEKKEKNQYFNLLNKNEINLIVFKKNNFEQKRIIDKRKIDSIIDRLRNSSLEFVKFSSTSKLYFYKNEILVTSIFYNNEYFKCEGKTYSLHQQGK